MGHYPVISDAPVTAAIGHTSRFHHGSHRELLQDADEHRYTPGTVDALIVPAARNVIRLSTAIGVAAKTGCVLMVLCSKHADAAAVTRAARQRGIDAVVIDISKFNSAARRLVPEFRTTALLTGTIFARPTVDTSLKRNLGLLVAYLAGWQRIVFLDDDMEVPNPDDLRIAAGLTEHYSAVGLRNIGFRDNSVVCHAFHLTGGDQDTFIGSGGLAVGPDSMRSFFPNIYNEDWFFLLDDSNIRTVTTVGAVVQQRFDPFDREERARSEELGDVLAEGLYWLLDQHRRVRDADYEFWRAFLGKRQRFIDEVLLRLGDSDYDPAAKRQMIASVKAARGRSHLISPDLCVAYLHAWRADRTRWRNHLNDLRASIPAVERANDETPALTGTNLEKLLAELGLPAFTHHRPK